MALVIDGMIGAVERQREREAVVAADGRKRRIGLRVP